MTNTNTPSIDQLRRALEIAEQIKGLESELGKLLGSGPASQSTASARSVGGSKPAGARRKMSSEARERIAAAQRARWAKSKGAEGAATGEDSTKPASRSTGKRKVKRTMSPEARAKLSEAAKKRWADKKSAQA